MQASGPGKAPSSCEGEAPRPTSLLESSASLTRLPTLTVQVMTEAGLIG